MTLNEILPSFPSFTLGDIETLIKKQDERRNNNGINDLIDSAFRRSFKIDDKQYDYICENATDAELELLIKVLDRKVSYAEKKRCVSILKKYKAKHANDNSKRDTFSQRQK